MVVEQPVALGAGRVVLGMMVLVRARLTNRQTMQMPSAPEETPLVLVMVMGIPLLLLLEAELVVLRMGLGFGDSDGNGDGNGDGDGDMTATVPGRHL